MITSREIRVAAAAGFVPGSGTLRFSAARGDAILFLASLPAQYGTYRLRFGVTFAALEKRAHGTPTRRCSAGHWVPVARYSRSAAFASIIRRASAAALESCGPISLGSFRGVVGYARGSASECHTLAHSNSPHPTIGGGGCAGRGRVGRSLPGSLAVFGYAPANGRRVPTHSPGKIQAAVRHERQRVASAEYRNNRGGE